MKIVMVGTGYVGLVSGTCFADIGHDVVCIDIDEEKIEKLTKGVIPIFEPGLDALVKNNVEAGRLTFSTSLKENMPGADAIFIAVGTPSAADGKADLQYVYAVAEEIAANLKDYTLIVDKSTVPVGTGKEVEAIIKKKYKGGFDVVSCPEFLREGSAIKDFSRSDRVVIGVRTEKAAKIMLDIFAPIKCEKVVTTVESSELIKYASNAFLATKISFINEIAHICEKSGADVEEVAHGVGLDKRIGPKFLKAGIGWGGSCFPKDVKALDQIAGSHGYDFKLLKSVIEVNQHQRQHFVDKIKKHFIDIKGKNFGVLGLAFKGNTDDIRESAAIDIIQRLVKEGAKVDCFDYEATANAKEILKDTVTYYEDPYKCVADNDAVLLVTEWPQFLELDWRQIKESLNEPVLFDGRNLLSPEKMREIGFTYYSVGQNHEEK
ncbi:UDP-glucose/GDP-mannose dehydrogenase family protein [Patescibacteria group bacterium]|nr:UDP-glucose/GDP-mannose dehydrogenase family protein [Patescibacteria group bacterium]MBU1674069.1 UDP-glucose/GDP-mannose dehydrogenase family protein [Patescibacteria group bacterium]MBU1963782.1 UDP-glucose/GDP-mannose dehydrogenase family protein [Patescibacteria group bacterium]